MYVVVDRDKCIGAAPCIAVAPNVYELDGEGKAVVLEAAIDGEPMEGKIRIKKEAADDETLKLAAESCPVKAIFVYDDEGKLIFPME